MGASVSITVLLCPPNHNAGPLFSVFNRCLSNLLGCAQECGGGSIWTTGKLSHQTPRPLALSGLVSPPSHTWKEPLLTRPGLQRCVTLLVAGYQSDCDQEPRTTTIQVKSGSSRSYQPPQNISLKHPIF